MEIFVSLCIGVFFVASGVTLAAVLIVLEAVSGEPSEYKNDKDDGNASS